MKTTQTATEKPNFLLKVFAVLIGATALILTVLVITGTFLNI